jgi:uncharacterized protein (DUF427 family)
MEVTVHFLEAEASRNRHSIGWSYSDPSPVFSLLEKHISFYPGRVECFLNGERVIPQPGLFYCGWIT